MRVLIVALAFLACAGTGQAASKSVQYVAQPAWVAPPPAPTQTSPTEGAALQVIYSDNQVRLGQDGDEFYSAYRWRILGSEGLALGNITATWSPNTDDMQVHRLRVIRDGQAIDVLKDTKFQIIQRENNLEYAMLNGQLTANLQVPGLRIGDELEFATTVRRKDPTLGERSQGAMALPSVSAPGAYRMRLIWPRGRTVQWRATPDIGELAPTAAGEDQVLTYELRDPDTAITADGSPPRFNLRRALQFSGFSSWAEVSNLFWPLYENASKLAPNSPVKVEAARIAASTSDPTERAAAALALVEERIRYVYVAMGDGNYRPASADETWTRRFGDCKAKSALLLALLRELGVPAEAALVHSAAGDLIPLSLPMAAAFDHVIVRTQIGGETYWLDGTRTGDRRLALLPEPLWTWALPVRSGAADLERITPNAPLLAFDGRLLEVDATGGFDVPAKVSAEQVVRGDGAIAYRIDLAQMSNADADRALKAYWREKYSWVEPAETSWRYDESRNVTVLTMAGEGTPEWEGEAQTGRWLDVPHAGMGKPAEFRRPKEQDQTAPWLVDFPEYRRFTTIIRLPPAPEGWTWGYQASELDEQIGGVSYWRTADLENGVLRTMMSRRSLKPEITAAEAEDANRKRTDFDDKISNVYLYRRAAKQAFIKAAADAGRDADALVAVGSEMISAKLWSEALGVYEKALALDPSSPDAAAGKAHILEQRDGVDAALRYLRTVKGSGPDFVMLRSRTLMRAGRREEALAVLKAGVETSENVEFLADAAQDALRAGDRELAMAAAQAAVKLAPEDVLTRQVRAHVYAYSAEPKWSQALPDLEAALRLQPEHPANFLNRGTAYYHLGRHDEALADLDEALHMDPLNVSAVGRKARVLLATGRREEAMELYDRMVVDDEDSRSLNNRCWERALANLQLDGAEADCARAVKLAPKVAGYWDSYALVALRKNDFAEALRRYNEALALSPKMAPSLYGRGLTRIRMGDEAGGRADIAAAKAITPTAGVRLTEAGLTP